MSRGAAACFSMDKICGVTVNMEAHVASVEPDDGVWLRGCVVHEHFFLLDNVGGGRSLLDAYFVEHDKHGGVNGARDVEEGAGDTLHICDATLSSFGVVVAFREYCTLAPYVGASHLWGECWGRGGMGCWKRSRALWKELGMEM